LAVMTLAMAALVPGALPARQRIEGESLSIPRIPLWSLLLLGMAALAISVAGVQGAAAATFALLAVGAALVGLFLVVDRRAGASVLPRAAFEHGPLKWMYVTIGLLMAATMVDMYVPLFGQRLAGMAPAAAGFFGAVLAVGWTTSEIASASLERTRTIVRLVAAAPVIMAIGLALGALVLGDDATWPLIVLWAIGLFIAGTGVGVAWPHLSAWVMGAVDDPVEAGTAAAAINTVQLICGAFGAGLAGVVVNLTEGGHGAAARWLFTVFAALAAAGFVASYRATRGR
jgi:hypothetical protein